MPKRSVAITGADGFLGKNLVTHFSNNGWEVIAFVRNASSRPVQKNVTYQEYDLTQSLPHKKMGIDCLIHTAFVKYDRKHPDALRINVEGAKRLLSFSRRNNIKKNIFISSMSSHEDAVSVYGKQKFAIEKQFCTPKDIVLRPGLIIGNGGIVKNMVDFMRSKHVVPLIGGGRQPLQIISIDDLASIISTSATSKQSGTFTVAHPKVFTYKSFYKAISRQLNIPVVFISVPFFVMLSLLKVLSFLRIPLDVGEDNLRGLQKLRAVDTKQDLAKLHVKPVSLRAALHNMEHTKNV